ncbi:MAG: hypothetical protein QOE28_443 [Solirubrobacteraceae bacterium]|nr:hypothetical protein [Solirubrobacteraceae bacterium]
MTSEVGVYGVVAAGTAPEGVRTIEHRGLAALVADGAAGPLPAARALREHWRVLELAATETTVLPVRFGTAMASDEAVVTDFLEPGHDGLATSLRELEGKVQLTVKGTYEEAVLLRGVLAASPAIARLKAQVDSLPEAASYAKRIQLGQLVANAVEYAREQDGALVMDRLAPLAVASRREGTGKPDAAVNAAFLVERARVEEFGGAVAALGEELAGRVRLRQLGPLAPYSFTDERAAAWG